MKDKLEEKYLLDFIKEMEQKEQKFILSEVIGKGYKKWAKTHTATWETDNLVHDLMGNPEKPIILKKL